MSSPSVGIGFSIQHGPDVESQSQSFLADSVSPPEGASGSGGVGRRHPGGPLGRLIRVGGLRQFSEYKPTELVSEGEVIWDKEMEDPFVFSEALNAEESDDVEFSSVSFRPNDNRIFRAYLRQTGSVRGVRRSFGKWIMCLLIGLSIGFCSWSIRMAVEGLSNLRFDTTWNLLQSQTSPAGIFEAMGVYILFTVGFAVLAALPPVFMKTLSGGTGLPEVRAFMNGIRMPNTLNLYTLAGKIFSLIFAYSSGLALGPEGPFIHIAAMMASGLSGGRILRRISFFFSKNSDTHSVEAFLSFPEPSDKRDFVTIGMAAGMSAVFGTPIGAVVYVLEESGAEWTKTLALRTLFCSMVSSFTVNMLLSLQDTMVSDYGLITLGVSGTYSYNWLELVAFVLLGFIAGFCGPLFIFLNKKITQLRMRFIHLSKLARISEIILVAAATAVISFWLPRLSTCQAIPSMYNSEPKTVTGFVGYRDCWAAPDYNQMASLIFNTPSMMLRVLFVTPSNLDMDETITPPFSFEVLGIVLVVFFLLMTVTAGLSLAGGVYIPNMVVGALTGRIVGTLVQEYFPKIQAEPGVYAMIGAAGFVSGALRIPISAVTIMIELTGVTSYVMPLTLVCMTAKLLGGVFTPSFYEQLIELKHLPYLQTRSRWLKTFSVVGEIMWPEVVCLKPSERVINIQKAIATHHSGFPIVDRHKRLLGLITRVQLIHLLKSRHFARLPKALQPISYPRFHMLLMEDPYPSLNGLVFDRDEREQFVDLFPYMNTVFKVGVNDAVEEAYDKFLKQGLRQMVVVSRKNCVEGIVTRKDFLGHHSQR